MPNCVVGLLQGFPGPSGQFPGTVREFLGTDLKILGPKMVLGTGLEAVGTRKVKKLQPWANRAKWPQFGLQPSKHATQLTAEAAALLALEKGQRPKLPDELFESFINSVQDYARRPGRKPSSQEILDKVNQIHFLTKVFARGRHHPHQNAVNHTTMRPAARVATWAGKGQG